MNSMILLYMYKTAVFCYGYVEYVFHLSHQIIQDYNFHLHFNFQN